MTGKGLIFVFQRQWYYSVCVCVLCLSTHLHSTLQCFLLQLPPSLIVSDTPQMPELFGLKAPPPLWMGIWPFDKPSFIKTSAPFTHLSVDRSQPPSFFIWRQPPQARSPGLPSCQSSTLLRSGVILMDTQGASFQAWPQDRLGLVRKTRTPLGQVKTKPLAHHLNGFTPSMEAGKSYIPSLLGQFCYYNLVYIGLHTTFYTLTLMQIKIQFKVSCLKTLVLNTSHSDSLISKDRKQCNEPSVIQVRKVEVTTNK